MRRVAVFLVIGVALLLPFVARTQGPPKPDMIFIMTDDHGWPFYSFMETLGHTHPDFTPLPQFSDSAVLLTPKLDRLAARGAVFPVAHSSDSVCVPSFRSTLLGLDTRDFDKTGEVVNSADAFMASYLKNAADYQVSYGFGKIWQRGYNEIGVTCVGNSDCDIQCTGTCDNADQTCEADSDCPSTGKCDFECKESIRSKTVGRRRIGPLLRFIRGAKMSSQTPWFVWYSPRLPHSPMNAKVLVEEALCAAAQAQPSIFPTGEPEACSRVRERCVGGENHGKKCGDGCGPPPAACKRVPRLEIPDDGDLNGPAALGRLIDSYKRMCELERQDDLDYDEFCAAVGATNAISRSDEDKAYLQKGKNIKYLQNVVLLDYWIGELLEFLRTEGLEDPSVGPMIFLQTDNGFLLKPSKRSARENGFRTPFLVSGPGIEVPWPPPAGPLDQVQDFRMQPQMVEAIDFIPTMLDYASAPVNQCKFGEGANLLPTPNCGPTYQCKGGSNNGLTCTGHGDCPGGRCVDTCGCLEGQSMKPFLDVTPGPEPTPTGRPELFGSKNGKPFLRTEQNNCRLFRKKCDNDQIFNLTEYPDEQQESSCELVPSEADLLDKLDCWFSRGESAKMCNPTVPCADFQ